MRTKWLSGAAAGDAAVRDLKGNRPYWQQGVFRMEIKPDLSRKFTFFCCPYFTEVRTVKESGVGSSDASRNKSTKKPKTSQALWAFKMLLASFFLSVLFNAISETALKKVNNGPAFLILATFVFLGIIFDIFGVAATTASEKPFHAMASKRVPSAKEALWLVKNAEKVSSFCNDVVGDICGIMSGSTAAIIIATLPFSGTRLLVVSVVMTGLVAGVTVGGKAFGKSVAIRFGNDIVFFMARIIGFFKRKKK